MRILILFLVLQFSTVFAQLPLNLVPNWSFEDYRNTINPYGCRLKLQDPSYHSVEWWQPGWKDTKDDVVNSPDWHSFKKDSFTTCVECDSSQINMFTDDKYVYIGKDNNSDISSYGKNNIHGESLYAKLYSKLELNKFYKLRIQATGRPQDHFCIHLSKVGETWDIPSNLADNMMCVAQITIPNLPSRRVCLVRTFETIIQISKSDLEYIIIQATGGNNNQTAVYLDKLELFEYCSENLIRQGRIYKYKSELEEANFITAGSVIGTTNLGEVRMLNGSLTTYKANTQVSLVEGFYVERGGDFTAKIGKCGSDCAGTDIPIPTEYVICDNQCITLDGGTRRGMTYEWRAVNPEHIAYLTETNTPNPVFCPPSTTTYGTYAYTVTVKNACGDSTTKTVYIHYDVNSNPNPNFQIISSNLADLPDNPSLTIRTELHTEYISVEVLDCDDNVLRSTIYKGGIDFVAGNIINWTMNEFSNPCECYKIRVRSKNYCYEEIKEEVLQWGRKRTPNNILLPTTAFCRDGKRWICIDASGTTSIDVQIFNRWGSFPIMTKTYAFTSNPYCFEIPNGNVFATGTYFMIVKFKGCDGSTYTSDRTTIFLPNCGDNLISDSSSNFTQIGEGDGFYSDIRYFNSETGLYDSLYTTVSPNPMTDAAVINYHIPKAGNVKVSVLNANFETRFTLFAGENVPIGDYSLQLNTAPLLTGTNYYMIELNNEKNAKVIKRISVIK